MRLTTSLPLALMTALLPGLALSQNMTMREIFQQAEIAYPSSQALALFSPESASSDYAGEPEDRNWAATMEARILEQIELERSEGLIVRRIDVECRSSTCAVLLLHATSNGSPGTVRDLTQSLRENLGFAGVSTAEKLIPLMTTVPADVSGRAVQSQFISGYVEIVLLGGIGTNLQASDRTRTLP